MNTYWISLPCDLLSSLASFQCSLLHHLHLSSDLGLSKYVNQHSHLNLSWNVRLSVLYDLDINSQFEQSLSHRQNERHTHPSWAPTKEPTVSCWRYTPTPKQDRFQDLLEAICPDFLHTTLSK